MLTETRDTEEHNNHILWIFKPAGHTDVTLMAIRGLVKVAFYIRTPAMKTWETQTNYLWLSLGGILWPVWPVRLMLKKYSQCVCVCVLIHINCSYCVWVFISLCDCNSAEQLRFKFSLTLQNTHTQSRLHYWKHRTLTRSICSRPNVAY